jgi:RNA polymerase sigma-70 factor (ECF subfamily)
MPRLARWASGRLPRWARRIADTGDVLQESIVRALRNLRRFDPKHDGALEAYLRRAVMNRIRDECRRSARAGESPLADEDVADLGPSPLELVIGREGVERYRRALSVLGADEQQAVVARVELGYRYDQIAVVLGKPSSDAARMAVRRALVRLAEEMGDGA